MRIQYQLNTLLKNRLGRWLLLLSLFGFLLSCRKYETNQNYLINNTNDTIVCSIGGGDFFYPNQLPPQSMAVMGHRENTVFELLEQRPNYGDSVCIYKGDDTLIWYAPLDHLPDSIHSFYNKTSWTIKNMGGDGVDACRMYSFIVSESDFNHQASE